MTEEKTKKESKFELVNIPTQHTTGIQTPTEEVINSVEEGLVHILNDLAEIKKQLG